MTLRDCAATLISFARWAYLSVLWVSSVHEGAGDTVAIMTCRAIVDRARLGVSHPATGRGSDIRGGERERPAALRQTVPTRRVRSRGALLDWLAAGLTSMRARAPSSCLRRGSP